MGCGTIAIPNKSQHSHRCECYTPLYRKWIQTFSNPEKIKRITEKIPLEQRMTTADEIANVVAFILSDKSGHTTGQLLYVDGGYTH